MIDRIGVWIHVLTRGHRPVWRWYILTANVDWRACKVCSDRKRRSHV